MSNFRHGKHIATVRLELDTNGWRPYFCPDCSKILFFRNGDMLAEQPGKAPIDLGVEIACKNRDCGKTLIVEGFSTRV